jgi:hypothetical protein
MSQIAHAYNPNYSEGRDQENHSSKLAQANSSQDLILKKKPPQKNGWQSGSSSKSTCLASMRP